MTDLRWYELSPPRDIDLVSVTAVLRPLANRPRVGLTGFTPLVVFEIWSLAGTIQWRLGLDPKLSGVVPSQLRAHLPRLGIREVVIVRRPTLLLAADVRLQGLSSPLRLDTASSVSAELQATLGELGTGEAGVVQWILGPAHARNHAPNQFDWAESLGMRSPRQADSAAVRLWKQKATEPLFGCHGRIGAQAAGTNRAFAIIRSLAGALKLADAEHASLRLGKSSHGRARKLLDAARPPFSWNCLLSGAELAALLGWPVQATVSDDLPVVGGHISQVPDALLRNEDETISGERLLGESLHPAQRKQLVTMPQSAAQHHLHIIGPTGSGKSTLLCGLVQADIAAGRGVLVVEPRGDLIEDVMARVPSNRQDDVVVIDPAAADRVVGLNVLAGPMETAERRADELVGLLAAMHGANFGPRTADVALHAILTASRLPDGVLPDVLTLLNNPGFRRHALAKVADPLVLGPWWAWYDSLSDGERNNIIAPLSNKLRAFLSRDALRRMVGQARPSFNFDDIFNRRRIVLVNLNRGLLGGPTANLLGALVLSNVWAALQRRASLDRERRAMVGLFVDEFQDYANVVGGLDFGDALAQSRGLGGAWTISHQNLGQLSNSLEAAIIANARSRITFRPATSDAKALATVLGGDLTADDLLRLRGFEACCQLLVNGSPIQPFSVRTRPLPKWTSDPGALRQASTDLYGVDGAGVDAALVERWQSGPGASDGPIGIKRRRAS